MSTVHVCAILGTNLTGGDQQWRGHLAYTIVEILGNSDMYKLSCGIH